MWRTERGRGEPPTLHDPHTPVVRSVTRAHATRVTGLAERIKPLVRGCRHCTPYTHFAAVAYGVYSGIGSLMAYTLYPESREGVHGARSYPQAMCTPTELGCSSSGSAQRVSVDDRQTSHGRASESVISVIASMICFGYSKVLLPWG